MARSLLPLFLAFVFSVCVLGAAPQRLVVEPEVLDLGDVSPKSLTHGHVTLRNLENRTIRILGILPACGCTEVSLSAKELSPGQTARLEVAFQAEPWRQEARKSIQIQTDSPSFPLITFWVKAVVNVDMDWNPKYVYLDWPLAPTREGQIAFRFFSAKPRKIRKVSCEHGTLVVNLENGSDGPILKYRPRAGAPYRSQDAICVVSDSTFQPDLKIPVYIRRPSSFLFTPATLTLGAGGEGKKRVIIRRKDGGRLGKLKLLSSHGFMKTRWESYGEREAVLELALVPGARIPEPVLAAITVVSGEEEGRFELWCGPIK